MICRKCGAEIPNNSIKCSNCGVRVNMYCPKCNTLNAFGEKHCINCGFELLVYCQVCSSVNVYSAVECRKCHNPLIKELKSNTKTEGVQVVESFSSQESTMDLPKQDDNPVIINKSEINSMPVISNNQSQYDNEADIKNIFKKEEKEIEAQAQEPSLSEDKIEELPLIQETKIEAEKENEIVNLSDTAEEISQEQEITHEEEKTQEEREEDEESEEEAQTPALEIQTETLEHIENIIKNSLQKHVIGINGEEGSGKTAVLKQIKSHFAKEGYLSLYGSCTPLVQITSFGFFQDAFLRIMGFPPYTNSIESFMKEFKKSKFDKVFSFLDEEELSVFLNIFYPSQKDSFDNIIENKLKIFSILEKVIKSFLLNNNLIIMIDNFDLIDGASYDFIVSMMKKGFFNNRMKLIAAYQGNKEIKDWFVEVSVLENKIFETVKLDKFTEEELLDIARANTYVNLEEVLNTDILFEFLNKASGNAIYMEQETAFLFDIGYLQIKNNEIKVNSEVKIPNTYATFDELVKRRINTLPPQVKNVLFMAAILGYRFASGILYRAVALSSEKSEEILNFLIQNLFIQKVDSYTYEFKSLKLWDLIFEESKKDSLFRENAKNLYKQLESLVLSSNLPKSITNSLSEQEEFDLWQETAKITAKLGDINLYVIALKKSLEISDKVKELCSSELKREIYEQMGKLLYEKSPKEAITYLSNVLDYYIKEKDIRKIIDISGYFIKSCYLTGNYFGVVEAVDAVLNIVQGARVDILEIGLIKARKLNALLNIGNFAQVISIAEDEVIPEINEGIKLRSADYDTIIISTYLNTKIVQAKAYTLQGDNKKAQVLIAEINQIIEEYKYNVSYYKLSIDIISALSETIEGNINKSNEILNNISTAYKTRVMDVELLAWWNLINVINRIMLNRTQDLRGDLFELTAFANNINEHFIKNIVKLLLGYVLNKEGNKDKSEEIYQEQVLYFSKEKNSMGALLSWSLLSCQYYENGDINNAINVAEKALEIANDPTINNYIFIVYLQILLGKIYSKSKDYKAAIMYFEKAINAAERFDLKYLLVNCYLPYAKNFIEFMKSKKIYSNEGITAINDIYEKAQNISKAISMPSLTERATREYSEFKTFCQLNVSVENNQ